VFRVWRRAVIGAHGGRGSAPIGRIRRATVGEVADLLGDAFAELVEVGARTRRGVAVTTGQ
jgi:hypothetical protein